jgi:hypothetical protein
MTKTDAISGSAVGNSDHSFSKSLWDGSDKIGFGSLDHPGYSMESNPEDFTGGWHAHRKVWEESDDENDAQPGDWIKDIIGDITNFDYQSMEIGRAPRILVLYGSLRPTSFSRKCGRFCRLGCHGSKRLLKKFHISKLNFCRSFIVRSLQSLLSTFMLLFSIDIL